VTGDTKKQFRGKDAHQRRGGADRGERREAAGAVAQNLTEARSPNAYLVRLPSEFPALFTATSVVCVDCSEATGDASPAGVELAQQV
jgi:hypothetical protein